MLKGNSKGKRVVLVHWKKIDKVEVFSNLKYFCLSYPQFSYNTLNNYISKEKIAYENDLVRVERKEIITKPKSPIGSDTQERTLVSVKRKVAVKEAKDDINDWYYWLSQPKVKRVAALTFLVSQMMKKGQRMDKTFVRKTNTIS
ncbi:hypothetical protein [Algoriphagus algorifonticola]|uniref:hypothetical protein n=1 Tax=Algoriphagus algorifonticola TaxID=2593007 RepID=UPI0011A5AF2B|nr:hypothetical protein [Algoriphagus algorifonticola]